MRTRSTLPSTVDSTDRRIAVCEGCRGLAAMTAPSRAGLQQGDEGKAGRSIRGVQPCSRGCGQVSRTSQPWVCRRRRRGASARARTQQRGQTTVAERHARTIQTRHKRSSSSADWPAGLSTNHPAALPSDRPTSPPACPPTSPQACPPTRPPLTAGRSMGRCPRWTGRTPAPRRRASSSTCAGRRPEGRAGAASPGGAGRGQPAARAPAALTAARRAACRRQTRLHGHAGGWQRCDGTGTQVHGQTGGWQRRDGHPCSPLRHAGSQASVPLSLRLRWPTAARAPPPASPVSSSWASCRGLSGASSASRASQSRTCRPGSPSRPAMPSQRCAHHSTPRSGKEQLQADARSVQGAAAAGAAPCRRCRLGGCAAGSAPASCFRLCCCCCRRRGCLPLPLTRPSPACCACSWGCSCWSASPAGAARSKWCHTGTPDSRQ